MNNERFFDLVETIFNKTFGIKKDKNHERHGAFSDFFYSDQLGRDLKSISKGKPIRNPSIYRAAIDGFFNTPDCIEKTTLLIETLELKGYLSGLDGADILTKCDQHTISLYKKLLLDIWNYYYTQYSTGSSDTKEVYSISQEVIDKIIKKYTKYRLPISLDFYQQRIPDIIDLLRSKNPDSLYSSLETEYVYFFKNVLENKSFYTLSREDRVVFFNALYVISDILNRIHHKDAYNIDLEMLTFFNEIYNDNFNNICVNDIRRIQGCIYAISIESTNESLRGNIKLTENQNMIRFDSAYSPITYKTKLQMCDTALRNLLTNNKLRKLDACFEEADYIPLYENRLQRKRDISSEEINELYVLSLVYSNIAVCTLQYIKQKIDISSKYDEYIEICETYHNRSRYIRTLIVRITQRMNGEESSEYIDALHFLATYYHSVATRYFYMKKYSDSILIRSVLYSFYMTLDLKEKARMQLDLVPITLYEDCGGNGKLYEQTTKSFIKEHRTAFLYLSKKDLISYDDFRRLVIDYHKFKELF